MKPNSKRQAGAKADSSTKGEATYVRQHRSKPNVIGIPNEILYVKK